MTDRSDAADGPTHAHAATRGRDRLLMLLVAAIALAAALPGLRNGFAYDDGWIIVSNKRLHSLQGWWKLFDAPYWLPEFGSRLYRPLASVGFALQWAIGGGSPLPFHVVNVALYALVCATVFALMREVDRTRHATFGALAGAALFAAHPVHVEAVANVVGQSELWVALLLTGCVAAYVRWRREGPLTRGRTAALLVAYAAACLYKENGIVLPALVALAEWLLVRDDRPRKKRIASARELLLAMALVAAVTLLLRHHVLGEVGGDDPHPAFVGMPAGARILAMLALVPRETGLLLWPARLLADYSPGDTLLRTTFGAWHVLGAAIVALLLWVAAACRTRRPSVTFGIGWMMVALAPVANVLVATGIIMAERAFFLPSVGLMVAVAALVAWAIERAGSSAVPRQALAGLVGVLVVAGVVRSVRRDADWRDNATIFDRLVKDAPLNGRAQYAYGGVLFERGDFAGGVRAWKRAIELLPSNTDVPIALSQRFLDAGRPSEAMEVLDAEIHRHPTAPLPRLLHIAAQLRLARFTDAEREAEEGGKVSGSPIAFRYLAQVADSVLIRAPNGDSIGMRPRPVKR